MPTTPAAALVIALAAFATVSACGDPPAAPPTDGGAVDAVAGDTGGGDATDVDTAPADPGGQDGAIADTAAGAKVDSEVDGTLDVGADAGADSTAEVGLDTKADGPPDIATDVQPDLPPADADAQVKPDATKDGPVCAYTCAIDCVCKKDFDGCDKPECESTACTAALAKIAAIKPKVQKCTAAKGCTGYEFPICGSAGCFQLPIAADADLKDLDEAAAEASEAGCSGFTCGCGPAPVAFCLGGQCSQCPPDCGGTCDEKSSAIQQLGAQVASVCGKDADCAILATGLCPIGAMPCGGVPHNVFVDLTPLKALVAAYAAGCGGQCNCPPPAKAKCDKGKCVAG